MLKDRFAQIYHIQKVVFKLVTDVKMSVGHARIRGSGKLQEVDLSPADEFQVLAGRGMRLSVSYMGRHIVLE
jgi:hypothetical protein